MSMFVNSAMKKICFILFVLAVSTSCHKKMAVFNASSFEEFENKPKPPKTILEDKPELKDLEYSEPIIHNEEYEEAASPPIIVLKKQTVTIFNHINTDKSQKKFEKGKINISQNENDTTKKKRKRNPIINDGVKIGIVFLGIAILLAILGFSSLSLLFGVVSAVFFVIGLKKYMRKKRLRNLFT